MRLLCTTRCLITVALFQTCSRRFSSYLTSDVLSVVVVVIGVWRWLMAALILSAGKIWRWMRSAVERFDRKREERIRAFSFTSGLISLMEQRGLAARQASNAARVCEDIEVERGAFDHARLQPRQIWWAAAFCH